MRYGLDILMLVLLVGEMASSICRLWYMKL